MYSAGEPGTPDHKKLTEWMDYGEKLCTIHAAELAKTRAGVMILDPSLEMLRPSYVKEHIVPSVRRVVNEIHKNGGFSIYHVCGNSGRIIREMCETGASALQVEKVDLKEALETVKQFNDEHPERPPTLLIGNFDNTQMPFMTPKKVRDGTLEMLKLGEKYKFFVPGTACEIPYETADRLVNEFGETVRGFKRSK
jgi:uroporphyrinogen-III decarboxylase